MLKLALLVVLFLCTAAKAADKLQRNVIMEKVKRAAVRNADIAATIQPAAADKHPCEAMVANWRKVASLDTSAGEACPTELQTFTNDTTSQKGCGRQPTTHWDGSCDSVKYPVTGSYTEVCGRIIGYQFGSPEAFEVTRYKFGIYKPGIDDPYVDGVSVTYGSSPRKHLWTYAAATAEIYNTAFICPCAKPKEYDYDLIPDFVGDHYYCESGRMEVPYDPESSWPLASEFYWDDPLWDGKHCHSEGNQCCERSGSGWFHRIIPETSDDIEVRICDDHDTESGNVALEQVEIYVN